MKSGIIKSYGKKALTIQVETMLQYYAPLENVDECVKDCLNQQLNFIPVKFTVNYKKSSGKNNFGPRYYAENVELDLVFS